MIDAIVKKGKLYNIFVFNCQNNFYNNNNYTFLESSDISKIILVSVVLFDIFFKFVLDMFK